MAYVKVENRSDFERALREFVKQVKREGIIEQCKSRSSFVPKSKKQQNVRKRFRQRILGEKFKGRQ